MQTPNLEFEKRLGFPSHRVAGVDEVGRGCLAGPVVAAAVLLPVVVDYEAEPWLREFRDSKLIRPEARERLAVEIERWALGFAIAEATVEEIDRVNIYHASHLAMVRAVRMLKLSPSHVLVDGNAIPRDLPCAAIAVVKGDQKCLSIAAASVIAKVWRDRHMHELDARFPGYGMSQHKGYPTPIHLAALRSLGVTEIHRGSFAPVAAARARLRTGTGLDNASAWIEPLSES